MTSNLVLIGMMGCGKSTVGAALAKRLRFEFADTDALIEARTRSTIPDLFSLHGEAYFRRLEVEAAEALSRRNRLVIACGGGLPLQNAAMLPLKRNGTVIWLRRNPLDILGTASMASRPLAQGGEADFLARYALREPIYQSCADFVVDAAASPDATVSAILEELL